MRLPKLSEYLELRRHLVGAWSFLATRKSVRPGPTEDLPFRGGFSVRVRNAPMDRHILHRIFARDEYRLKGIAEGSLDTILDVGAHIGLFAVRAAPLARRILCFEPSPDNRALLEHNLADSRFSHVTIDPRAVSGRAGKVTLRLSENPSAHTLYGEGEGVSVDAVTLEGAFEAHGVERCDLLKLDCEGAEYELLRAVPDPLWPRIHRIHMECHAVPDDPGKWDAPKLGTFLEGKGYACEVLPSKRHEEKGHLFARRPRS